MLGRRIMVDGVVYPALERLPFNGTDRLIVLLPDGSERVAVWRLVRWEWEEGRDGG
jgi:hypothetical protein